MPLFKICLLGAESTGKTSLTESLASALRAGGYWAQTTPEALRVFCERFGRLPDLEDEPAILTAQKRAESAARSRTLEKSPQARFLICDSSPLLTAFTSYWYFKDGSLIQEGLDHQASYLHCYLTEPSLPWQPDGIQRDHPQVRAKFHRDLKLFLDQHKVLYEALALRRDVVSKNTDQARVLAAQLLTKAKSLRYG
jgi:nicotinamide riboside kinase